MDVRVHRVGVRRHEHPWPAASHLMLIEIELREGLVIHELHPVTRLDQVRLEEVPVVVVSGVVVVEPGHACPLVLGIHVLAVPVGDQDLPVGIRRGDEDGHDVVENPLCNRVCPAGQLVHQLDARLRRADLGRVDIVIDERRRGGSRGDLLGLGTRDPALRDSPGRGSDLVEPCQVSGRRDGDGDERVSVRGRPRGVDHDPVGHVRDPRDVFEDFVPAGQLLVGAHHEAEVLFGRWNPLRGNGPEGDEECEDSGGDADCELGLQGDLRDDAVAGRAGNVRGVRHPGRGISSFRWRWPVGRRAQAEPAIATPPRKRAFEEDPPSGAACPWPRRARSCSRT